jgi:hypothetical protein
MKRLTLDGRDDGDNEGRRFSWLLVHFAGMFVHRRLEFMCILAGFWAFASTLDASLIVATRAHHLGAKTHRL